MQASPEVRNPYSKGIIAMWFILLPLSLILLASIGFYFAGWWDYWPIIIAAVLFMLFFTAQSASWIYGSFEVRKINAFLASPRPLLRWTYTQMELEEMRQMQWEEEKDDWKLQLFGMTFIFALVGALTGILGLLDGDTEFFFIATTGWTIFGITLGAFIALGNNIALKRELSKINPIVALGSEEFFYNGNYQKINNDSDYIKSALFDNRTNELSIELQISNRIMKSESGQNLLIKVPKNLAKDVETIFLPKLKIAKEETQDEILEEQEPENQ